MADDVPGIEALEEIELVPEIQVVSQGDQALLKGNLLLSGAYLPEGENRETQTLTHYIPVEITLPMNRVSRLEEIAVEIENFDIELLSRKSINVTGVLSLHGIEMVSSAPRSWREEDLVFTHRAEEREDAGEREAAEPAAAVNAQTDAKPVAAEASAEVNAAAEPAPAAFSSAVEPIPAAAVEPQPKTETAPALEEANEPAAQLSAAEEAVPPAANAPVEAEEALEAANEPGQDMDNAPVEAPEVLEAIEEAPVEKKSEPKIAFGAKPGTVTAPGPLGGLNSLLGKRNGGSTDASAQGEAGFDKTEKQARNNQQLSDAALKERLEWKNLLMRKEEEGQGFRKVRMCIVQKEETMDTIAERYNISAKQIALYNRMAEPSLQEGQIIYIPAN
nr:LysM peptidoglycan-binding domain-containing protein [Paenibacillus turpanensis]